MVDYNDKRPVRIKILTDNNARGLENQYNEFARTHDIVASQYKMVEGLLFSICIWYKWEEAATAYEEVKNDQKIMGGTNDN